jgi:hypothetical protein
MLVLSSVPKLHENLQSKNINYIEVYILEIKSRTYRCYRDHVLHQTLMVDGRTKYSQDMEIEELTVLITFDRLQHFKMCCTIIECQEKCRMIILQTFLHL